MINKFQKTTYFIMKKHLVAIENFRIILKFLNDLGDSGIQGHLKFCVSRAHYTSVNSADG